MPTKLQFYFLAIAIWLLPIASASAQQFPVVPDHTVIGRVGTGTGSGPAQAIPFPVLGSDILGGAVLSLNIPAGNQSLSVSPTGNPTGGSLLTTFSSLNMQTTTTSATNREFGVNIGMISNTGSGIIGNINDGKVAEYSGIVGNAGTGSIWAKNSVTTMSPGSGTSYFAQGYELDFNNNAQDTLSPLNPSGFPSPFAGGMNVSGAGAFRSTFAYAVGGGKWQHGYMVLGDVSDSAFYEFTNPGSTYGLNLQGPHTFGVFVNSSAALNIFNGPVGAHMQGATVISGASLDVRSGVNNRLIFRGPVSLGSGNSISSVNDANSGTVPLEILAGGTLFSGTATNTFGGPVALKGSSSGTATIQAQAAAGTPTLTLPTGNGTFAVSASGALSLSATTGALTCPTCFTTAGGAITGSTSLLVSGTFGTLTVGTSSNPTAGNLTTVLDFQGLNASAAPINYGQLTVVADSVTAGAEAGDYRFATTQAGALANRMQVGAGLQVGAPTGADEGVGTVNVSGRYFVNGTGGLASKTCTINTANVTTGITLTITGGLVTASTTC